MQQNHLLNEMGLYEIYPHWHTPFWHTKLFYGVLGLFVLLMIAVTIYFVVKKYKLKKQKLHSWDRALLEIDNLKKNKYTTVEQGKSFYYALTALLKRYIRERYGLDTAEKTDQEFLKYLQDQDFSKLFMDDIATLFEGSTTIKFANASAAQQQIDRDFATAISFIKKTIPVEKK